MRLERGLFNRQSECRAVAEHFLRGGRDSLFDLGRGDSPSLFGLLRGASDQRSGNVVAVTALALGRALHIKRLAALIEQFADERTGRRLDLAALGVANPSIAEPLPHALPQVMADDGLVLSRMTFVLVPDLASVDRVG
jgi:hypothetical protein